MKMDNKKVGISIGIVALIAIIIAAIFIFMPKAETTYKITFDNNGVSQEIEVNENGTITKPADPTREGYTFEGWYYNGEKFDFTTKVTEDMVLEARWTSDSAKKWVVTFDSNGGNNIANLNVEGGKKIVDIPSPTREGYTFEGWYYNDVKFDFSTVITSDITLVAKWVQLDTLVSGGSTAVKLYTVSFDSKGGTPVSSQRVENNNTAKKPANPTREGYTFIGWYNGTVEFNFGTKVTNNITLTAKWQKVETPEQTKTYTVTFNTSGGSKVVSQIVEEGKTATKPSDPTLDGYTFVGWYYKDTQYNFNTKVNTDITLTAKWQKNDVITYEIEETDSYVGQVKIFVLKNGVKVNGIVDITLNNGNVVKDKEIPASGYVTNSNKIKTISNVRVK